MFTNQSDASAGRPETRSDELASEGVNSLLCLQLKGNNEDGQW